MSDGGLPFRLLVTGRFRARSDASTWQDKAMDPLRWPLASQLPCVRPFTSLRTGVRFHTEESPKVSMAEIGRANVRTLQSAN